MKKDSFFGADKTSHFIMFFCLSLFLCKYFNDFTVFVICFVLGFGIELFQTTKLYDIIMNKIESGKDYKGKLSWKDIVANVIGIAVGILIYAG